MMRIAVCDDRPEQLEQIHKEILAWNGRTAEVEVCCYDNGDALLNDHHAAPFDIVFLDVIMPLLGGMEIAKEIRRSDLLVKLVFLSVSSEYAVDAFGVKASNYLLKPVVPAKLHQCLDELYAQSEAMGRRIYIKGVGSLHRVPVRNIEYIESQNKRILFVLSDGQTILSCEPLYAYEEKLTMKDGFFKCSRSFIVNINHIDTFTHKEIRTHSGARIPISRSCHREFESAYLSYLFGSAEKEVCGGAG